MKDQDSIPYFAWDRKETVKDICNKLKQSGKIRIKTAAWIMREAAFRDVWQFITPAEVWGDLDKIRPYLGRKRKFWEYILGKWHELGKI